MRRGNYYVLNDTIIQPGFNFFFVLFSLNGLRSYDPNSMSLNYYCRSSETVDRYIVNAHPCTPANRERRRRDGPP